MGQCPFHALLGIPAKSAPAPTPQATAPASQPQASNATACSAGDMPFALLLKTSTQELHDRAESHEFQKDFVDGRISRDEYALFLAQAYHLHKAFEGELLNRSRGHTALAQLVQPYHFREKMIVDDLRDLGFEPNDFPVHASATAFIEHLHHSAAQNPASLIGVLYVLEGATNGNKVIIKGIRKGLGLMDGQASRYLDPHGPEQRPRWTTLKAQFDQVPLTQEEKLSAVTMARETFDFFGELSGEMIAIRSAALR